MGHMVNTIVFRWVDRIAKRRGAGRADNDDPPSARLVVGIRVCAWCWFFASFPLFLIFLELFVPEFR